MKRVFLKEVHYMQFLDRTMFFLNSNLAIKAGEVITVKTLGKSSNASVLGVSECEGGVCVYCKITGRDELRIIKKDKKEEL